MRLTKTNLANKALLHGIVLKAVKNNPVNPYKLETVDNQKHCSNLQDVLENIEFYAVHGKFKNQRLTPEMLALKASLRR